jgi:sortase A
MYYLKGKRLNLKIIKKIAGGCLILLGVSILIYFFSPLISYQIFLSSTLEQAKIEVPIPKYMVVTRMDSGGLGSLVTQGINALTRNYHDARNWYPSLESQTQTAKAEIKVDSYSLSIPKLKIENAQVSTTDYDLDRHLVQYLGTSIPGEKGTAVIFGHSTIPAWFDQKNYKTIFATLHKIKIGDEITAKVADITYKYKIFSIIITTPEDTNILSQSFDNSYLTIVTCTPPGTIWKRLVVRAALEEVATPI